MYQGQQIQSAKSAVSTLSAVQSARRALGVERAVGELDDASCGLSDAVRELFSVLEPIMAAEFPVAVACDREQGSSEVAERVLSNADRVREAASAIRRIIERL